MKLKFAKPRLENFSYSTNSENNDESHGLFILSGLEDAIKLWALSKIKSHKDLIEYFKVNGEILGGGKIAVDHHLHPVLLYSYSEDHGALPNNVLRNYFYHHGYAPRIQMIESEVKKETVNWLRKSRLY